MLSELTINSRFFHKIFPLLFFPPSFLFNKCFFFKLNAFHYKVVVLQRVEYLTRTSTVHCTQISIMKQMNAYGIRVVMSARECVRVCVQKNTFFGLILMKEDA